jgi:uncharacterized protein YebE (UPF0316 family)
MATISGAGHRRGMEHFRPLLIGVLVLTEVAIWQWRMVIAHRGRRATAVVLGALGAGLQITAISQVVADVKDVLSVAAYAIGVGCGVLFGLIAGERLTPGRLEVNIVSDVPELPDQLWQRGWPATVTRADSRHGPVMTVIVDIDRREEGLLRQHATLVDPRSRVTAKEVRPVVHRYPQPALQGSRRRRATVGGSALPH